jgi:hypothetical protein
MFGTNVVIQVQRLSGIAVLDVELFKDEEQKEYEYSNVEQFEYLKF